MHADDVKDDVRILMQQHYGGVNFFSKPWADYRNEFGHVAANYWIGNERLHQLTNDGRYKLRVDMLAKGNNQWYWAEYSTFRVYDEASGYTLNIGGYKGNAGDSMASSNGRMFSTKDADKDTWSDNCALHGSYGNGGGFWYSACGSAFPNSPHDGTYGFGWNTLSAGSYKLLAIRMTLIPLN